MNTIYRRGRWDVRWFRGAVEVLPCLTVDRECAGWGFPALWYVSLGWLRFRVQVSRYDCEPRMDA
jgi:hypothetical protein